MANPKAVYELADLDGSNGFVLNGIDSADVSGRSVSSAGDVNGDGFDDVIVGARFADPGGKSSAGESYVVFGKAGGFAASLDLSVLDGSNGFVINGIDAVDLSGYSVSSAGDVNGDGFDDLIIGAPGGDPGGVDWAGESYVVFGKAGGFAASLNLSTLDGNNGFVLNGIDENDDSGTSVSSAGDVNGDGFDDLIIGAPGGDPGGRNGAGESYVVFGKAGGFAASLNLSALDGGNGFVLNGIDAGDFSGGALGGAVSSAGDVNGDGFDDVIIGAHYAGPVDKYYAGESYVVFGKAGGFAASLELASLDGNNGFILDGINVYDFTGFSVSSAGDVNGDGFGDLIIGAAYADVDGKVAAGKTYVVFGKAAGFAANLDLEELDGGNGFVLRGIDSADFSGFSVSSAGDVNGDGFDDLIISAWGADPGGRNGAGESYVVFGKAGGFAAKLDLADLDGSSGLVLNGINAGDGAGFSVNSAGDVDGDGLDDIIIGADDADPDGREGAGESYVVFGATFAAVKDFTPFGTPNPDHMEGTLEGEVMWGEAGADNMFGNGGGDKLYGGADGDDMHGGAGNDRLWGEDGNDQMWGDTGEDSLQGGRGNDFMLGGNGDDQMRGNQGRDFMDGGAGNDEMHGDSGRDTMLGGFGNDTMFGKGSKDTIDGGAGDDVIDGGQKDDVITGGDGNDCLKGGTGNDLIDGGHQNDTLLGGDGADTMAGDGGMDALDGGKGSDVLDGGGGNDFVAGGGGNDTLVGGQGADTFIFRQDEIQGSTDTDTIIDWDPFDIDEKILLCGQIDPFFSVSKVEIGFYDKFANLIPDVRIGLSNGQFIVLPDVGASGDWVAAEGDDAEALNAANFVRPTAEECEIDCEVA